MSPWNQLVAGNPPVTFITRGVELKSVRKVGQGNHLRMTVRHPDANFIVDAIAFKQGDRFDEITLREQYAISI